MSPDIINETSQARTDFLGWRRFGGLTPELENGDIPKVSFRFWKNPVGLSRQNFLILTISGVILLGFAVLQIPHGNWEYPRFDSVVDQTASLMVFITSLLLLLSGKISRANAAYPKIAQAFLAVAILRFLAGTNENMATEIWLRRLSSLALAISFFIWWLPFRQSPTVRGRAYTVGLVLVFVFGLIAYISPNLLPPPTSNHGFSPIIDCLSLIAGFLFFAAAFLGTRESLWNEPETISLVLCCFIFGLAAVLYPFSLLWGARWWVVQFLETLPQVIVLLIFFIYHVTLLRKNREELEQALSELRRSNEELESFSSVASHDLVEPLRMISSYCQLLARDYNGRLDEQGKEYLAYAVDGAKRMTLLIRAFLEYSHVGRGKIVREEVDCRRVIDQVLSNLSLSIQERGADITLGELPTVEGDPILLSSLFQNLISNAIKYQKNGSSPRVEITAAREGCYWVFSVRDNGIGIQPEHLGKLFGMFQRLHARDEYSGTGIGLATCKKIVEKLGGRIWVESVPDRGSTFFFTLPVTKQPLKDFSEHRAILSFDSSCRA